MPPHSDETISFSERMATAFVSTVAAAATLLVLPWVFAANGRGAEPLILYSWAFSKTGLVIIATAAAAGFFLGSEQMANVFSLFWGTHPVLEEEWFQKCLVGLIIVVAVGLVGHLVFTL